MSSTNTIFTLRDADEQAKDVLPATFAWILFGITTPLWMISQGFRRIVIKHAKQDIEQIQMEAAKRRDAANDAPEEDDRERPLEEGELANNKKPTDDKDEEGMFGDFLIWADRVEKESHVFSGCFHSISGGAFVMALLQTMTFEAVMVLVNTLAGLYFLIRVISIEFGNRKFANTITAVNVYQHFDTAFARSIFMAFGQVSLIMLYGWGMWERGSPDLSSRRVYWFYWVGVLLQMTYFVGTAVGKSFEAESKFWATALALTGKKIELKGKPVAVGDWIHLRIRFWLSSLINTAGYTVVLLALPVQLAGLGGPNSLPDPMSVVFKAVSAYFIFKLDDLKADVTFEIPPEKEEEKPDETMNERVEV